MKLRTYKAWHQDWLYLITVIITVLQMTFFTLEFFSPGILKLPKEAPFLYFIVLAAWIIKKEIEKWLKNRWIKNKGEFYVLAWLALIWMMLIISALSKGKYEIPPTMIETVIYVVMAYFGTYFLKFKRYQKLLEKRLKEKQKKVEASHKHQKVAG